ncbi:hypothetical protein [Helicobacter pylori]|nr:hypothetical protein [Helicobacter pylori]WRF77380.1 hypothetical protein FNE39_04865 [Helicobacter pylori]
MQRIPKETRNWKRILKNYPKIGYIKANGVYQGSKEPSFLIYALGVDLLTTIRELG